MPTLDFGKVVVRIVVVQFQHAEFAARELTILPNLSAANIVCDRRRRSGHRDRKTSKVERTA